MSAANADPLSEIFIYTTYYNKKHEGPPIECLLQEISVKTHWIFVFKSGSVTMYVDAYNNNEKLDTRISYEEPQDVFTKTSFGFVNATANDIHNLIYESRQIGMTYGLNFRKASCQSFIKEILKKLGISSYYYLKTINDTTLGYFLEPVRSLPNTFSRLLVPGGSTDIQIKR
ncbi:UNVERIFIED_CONTAM: hypothetical protein RMT77_013029 [Armadillidium vulgare]